MKGFSFCFAHFHSVALLVTGTTSAARLLVCKKNNLVIKSSAGMLIFLNHIYLMEQF